MKHSKQRDAILNYLLSTKSHPCADEIYTEVRKSYPNISLGTVYRNLSLLSEHGMILKIDTGSGKEHYDGFSENHYHFACTECDRVYDVEISVIDGINDMAAKSLGCQVDNHSVIFYGKCKGCK